MNFLAILLLSLYSFSLLWLVWGARKLSKPDPTFTSPTVRFSILIPYRNEAKHMQKLLQSLMTLNYPKNLFEIILIDDHSEDDSTHIAQQAVEANKDPMSLQVHFLKNPTAGLAPKKEALTYGLTQAQHEWIITTDADCQVPKNWLQAINSAIGKDQPVMLCGPVRYLARPEWVYQYQLLDGLSLQGVAMGGLGHGIPMLCNGANLAYSKTVFNEVGGFYGNDHIASGDDIFLMEKVKKAYPGKIQFLASVDNLVMTQAQPNWPALIRQRIRWASKTTKQNNPSVTGLGSLVFFTNLFPIMGVIWVLFHPLELVFLLVFMAVKMLVDTWYIHQISRKLQVSYSFFYLQVCMLIYPLVTSWVFIASLFGSYTWKGRSYSKQPKIN